MQEHDARILRGAAIPTAAVGVVAAVAATVTAGVPGLIGAAVGTLLILGFFAVSAFVVSWTGQRHPHLLLPIAFVVYTTKIGVLAVALVLFGGTTAFDHMSFALTSLGCVIAWLTGQAIVSSRVRQLYVEPAGDDTANAGPEAGAGVGNDR
ncbi:hypothetical protein ACFPZ0_21745 [Streptomonospora nanhaiensis]|uniref:ATP synthase protein I n=1 Tax=Streptomonospora nanhaiensis TaxID=1323731 RepID=A0A853BLL6_9ACTN|nr:hypothetical protein [Streptomonospora nanhaiensis]MBV2365311.1 hypothetical protein [Streptomonospora nanhaiensis]MBX9390639.1 hypothetical protein [Streptomonospora nanhaiensis]NYI95880.1 ATP synthase protein I [Streptomonospora nanhaiensis]